MRLLRSLTLLAATALLAAAAAASEPCWVVVDLPAGFTLDLASGQVTARPAGAGGVGATALRWVDGRFATGAVLRRVPPSGSLAPSARFTRALGRPWGAEEFPEVGCELVFDLGADGWGALRVLALTHEDPRIELAWAEPDAKVLAREPAAIEVSEGDGRIRVAWRAEPGRAYRVTRAVLGAEAEPTEAVVLGGEWTDPEPALARLLEYTVSRADVAGFGSRARARHVEIPDEERIPLVRGARLDLLTGARSGDRADVEVVYLNPPSVALRPLEGAGLEVVPASEDASWVIPAVEPGNYPDNAVRTATVDHEAVVRLPEGIFVRLAFTLDDAGQLGFRRLTDVDGGRCLPRPPAPPVSEWTEVGPRFCARELGPEAPHPEAVVLVAERERPYRSGEWLAVARGEAGERCLVVAEPASAGVELPLARYRFRHAYVGGVASPPGEPVTILLGDASDEALVETWLADAFRGLLDPDFDNRLAARGVIESLGRRALPRLEEALRSPDPELAAAARDLLIATASAGGGHVELLLRARGVADGIEAEPPAGLFDPDPARRARVLLGSAGPWRGVLARADPDAGVALLAEMLDRDRVDEDVAPNGRPLSEEPPGQRGARPPLDWRMVEDSEAPELARAVRASADPADPEAGLVTLMVAHALESAPRERRERVEEDARLALRLLERWRESGDPDLIAAARALAGGPGAELAAWRELTEARLRGGAAATGRTRIVLAAPTWSELESELAALSAEGVEYVDLVLPAGHYAPPDEQAGPGLELAIDGLRLVGEGDVVLRSGLRVQAARDVVLEGLTVESGRSTTLMATDSEVALRDVRLRGVQTVLMVTRGRIEFDRAECSMTGDRGGARWVTRLAGGADLVARETLLAGGTLTTSEGSEVYLDHCVVDAGDGTAIQGQRGDRVVLRDVLVRGEGIGIAGVERGVAVGVVFDVARDPVLRGTTGLKACPLLATVTERTPALTPDVLLERCPIEGR